MQINNCFEDCPIVSDDPVVCEASKELIIAGPQKDRELPGVPLTLRVPGEHCPYIKLYAMKAFIEAALKG